MYDQETKTKLLPVAKVIIGAFVIPWQRRARFTQALAFPAVGLLLIETVPLASDDSSFVALYSLLGVILVILFVVTCHRLVLLSDQGVARLGSLRWTWRETRFLGWSLAMMLLAMLVSIPVAFLLTLVLLPFRNTATYLADPAAIWWVDIVFVAPFFYFVSRWSLGLPATAVDERPDLRWAWRCSRGNGWRLVLVVWVLPLLFTQVHQLFLREQSTVIENLVVTVLGLASLVIEIAALSLSYRELSQNASPE